MLRKEFKKGDSVAIIRHRHGWEDGAIKGTVSSVRHRRGGAAFYTVVDADGQEYDVRSTKDLKPHISFDFH